MAASKKAIQNGIFLILTLAIVGLVNFLFLRGYRAENMDSFLASIYDKTALLESTPAPRIILVGGSNVAFGFDSHALAEKSGMAVINTGIQGNLGIRFMLNSIKPYLRPGDLVLVSPEYHILLDSIHSGEILDDLLILYPQGISSLSSLQERWLAARDFLAVHAGAIKESLEARLIPLDENPPEAERVYFRSAFDPETGDITTNFDSNAAPFTATPAMDYQVPNPILDRNMEFLNQYAKEVAAQQVRLVFVFPAVGTIEDPSARNILDQLESELHERLHLELLNTWRDSQFENQYLFDTLYHLNASGRAIHTQNIADALCSGDYGLKCKP